MPIRYWVLVPDNHGEAILKQDQSVASRAKRAFCLLVFVGRSDSPEVSVIPVPLHSVALIAECLKVADLGPASFDARVMWSTSKARSSAGTPQSSQRNLAFLRIS